MSESKSSLSNAGSYTEIGEFRDRHDLGDFEDKTYPVEFDVPLEREVAKSQRKPSE